MILVRIDGVTGDVVLDKYKKWFQATSFNFQVGESTEIDEENENDPDISEDGAKAKRGSRPKKKDKPQIAEGWRYLELTIDKEVDAASVYLMQLAMKCRANMLDDKRLSVDIHVIEQKVRGTENKESVRPYLLIRLENAIISGWSLSGEEDGKASEEVTLWYDRSAMKFITFLSEDSKDVKQVHGPLGWDLEEGKAWDCSELAKDK